MYIDWQHKLWRNPLVLLPLLIPCYFQPHSLLLTWKPSFGVMRSCPPWPQVTRKLTSPFPSPPHPLPISSPFQIPNTSGQLCALLRRHRDPAFSWSWTRGAWWSAVLCGDDYFNELGGASWLDCIGSCLLTNCTAQAGARWLTLSLGGGRWSAVLGGVDCFTELGGVCCLTVLERSFWVAIFSRRRWLLT